MGRFAQATGRTDEAAKYFKRAMNYQNLYDPAADFMRGKKQNGEWPKKFDPYAWGGDFTEGSAWHYLWSVFQDPAGLIKLMGGKGPFTEKLDAVFTAPPKAGWTNYGYKIHEITEMQAAGMGQYAHGNQPVQHAIYFYCYAGQPWKTQARVREVMQKLYNPYPNGYCGDEDNGQTSAWYVFSALGFYPVCPGVPQYVLGSPLFPRTVLTLPSGSRFTIEARGNSPENVYIRRAELAGRELTRNFITHEEIMGGGSLVLEMDARPEMSRGTKDDNAPYSFSKN
jgi:predicted alpha-1,2-mannosidase